jgi:hypothetical protein
MYFNYKVNFSHRFVVSAVSIHSTKICQFEIANYQVS